MDWQNGRQWREFQKRMARQAAACRALGMTEEQIEALRRFDLEVYRSDRRYYRHHFDLDPLDRSEETWAETLTRRFPAAVTVQPEELFREGTDWLDDVDSPALHAWLKSLSREDRELLVLLAFGEKSQREISKLRGCTPQNVSQALRRLRQSAAEAMRDEGMKK